MAQIILWLAVAFLFVLLFIFIIRTWLFGRHILRGFKTSNVVVDGKKGKGKDLLFQWVIHKRKARYYSNIDYGGKRDVVRLHMVSAEPNTYKDLIEENVQECQRWAREGEDVYISDGGIYLPSYMDSQLYRSYPSFPVYYALSRHTARHNIHVNIQNCGRLWKALREQADFFVHCRGIIKLPFVILLKCNTYDKLETAMQACMPVKARLMNKYSKAERDIYVADRGEIRQGWVIIPKGWIKYDTRYFEKVLYKGQPRIED